MQDRRGRETTTQTRRTVLKTLGGAGVTAATLSGLGSAATGDAFLCSLDIPSLFTKDDDPLDPEVAGLVRGWPTAHGIFLPDDAWATNCGTFGINCDAYEVNIPFTISWKTNASSSDLGTVYAHINIDTPATSYDPTGWGASISSTETTIDSTNAIGSLTAEYDQTSIKSDNYFRATDIELELDFKDSNIYDGTISESVRFSTPNKGLLNAKNLIQTSADVYDSGVDLADELVSVDLGTLRKAARLWAYSSTTATGVTMLDADSLPAQTVVKGISAFEGPIENRQEKYPFDEGCVETVAGPTIVRSD